MHAPDGHVRTKGAVHWLRVESPEVGLDCVEHEREYEEDGDGGYATSCGAESFLEERVADGHVALDGEAEDQERAELLGSEEGDGESLAQIGIVEDSHLPFVMHLE